MTDKLNRKLTAIMFADIVSYSRMMGANEEEALKILSDFDSLSIPIVEKFNGTLIKKNGDEIFCEFLSAKNAVDASVEIQNELATYNDSRPKDFKLEVRIGVHIGDVVKKGEDIFGDGVNVAARIQPLASPGGICISGAVSEALSSHPGYDIVSKGKQELKHIVQQHSIFDLKTGHERKINTQANRTTFISKIKKPIYLIPFLVAVSAILYFGYNILSSEKGEREIKNIYFDITSSENYLDNYYVDYGHGSHHFYQSEKHDIKSIPDSLRIHILELLYSKLTSEYITRGVYIESSFDNKEYALLNNLYFPKTPFGKIQKEDFKNTQNTIDELNELLIKRSAFSNNSNIDGLLRFFIYEINDKENDESYMIYDKSIVWGSLLDQGIAARSWEAPTAKYEMNELGIELIIEKIFNSAKGALSEPLSVGKEGAGYVVGEVVGVLKDDMIKIKTNQRRITKNMKLSTFRVYHWAKGGAETCIEDLTLTINYLKENDPDNSQIKELIEHQSKVRTKLKNNEYYEHTTSNVNKYSYDMKVVDIIDDFVIAKVYNTKVPKGAFIYRVGDKVHLID